MKTLSEKAVIGRINRRLQDEQVCVARHGTNLCGNVGRYYALDDRNVITATHIDLETWARDLGALLPGEAIAT